LNGLCNFVTFEESPILPYFKFPPKKYYFRLSLKNPISNPPRKPYFTPLKKFSKLTPKILEPKPDF
jgi:hypothetical protein